MTLSEFRAWFDGFTEDMSGAPNLKQWKRIQSRVKEISGAPTSYPVYIDRYVRPHWDRPYWASYGSAIGAVGQAVGMASSIHDQPRNLTAANGVLPQDFDSHTAMNAIGRADALALAN